MTHVTCRLTAKNRDQLWNPTLGNRAWATFVFYTLYDVSVQRCAFGGPIVATPHLWDEIPRNPYFEGVNRTNPEQIEVMEIGCYSRPTCNKLCEYSYADVVDRRGFDPQADLFWRYPNLSIRQ